ncbi:Plant basic secretory family protein [Rhynchospora pubera]|uniref:Plant basic secretory family protein n=1 Tax=Rhynchospora pubera TaxID=906938 RepID=A0AAV8GIV7_9POAL|nr:Plant basic secretory family protein [Rhynchospora pubera]
MKNSLSIMVALLAVIAFATANAVQYKATNNAQGTSGGTRFDQHIGLDHSKEIMATASNFIWTTFNQAPANRKSFDVVTLIIEPVNGVAAATSQNEIHFNSDYIASYSGDVKTEFDGVIYHEMTHVWQWNGQGQAPGGLIEGIADFVRLKANYAPSHWRKPGQGDRWDQGYEVTAYFLDYCNGLKNGFVAQLNAKMKDGYSNDFFVQLLGKTVDQLWSDYKAKYGNQ